MEYEQCRDCGKNINPKYKVCYSCMMKRGVFKKTEIKPADEYTQADVDKYLAEQKAKADV